MYAHFMKNRHFYLQRPKFWPIYLLVAGCGGGGGGSDEPISNPIAQNQSLTLTVYLEKKICTVGSCGGFRLYTVILVVTLVTHNS